MCADTGVHMGVVDWVGLSDQVGNGYTYKYNKSAENYMYVDLLNNRLFIDIGGVYYRSRRLECLRGD